MVQTGSWQILGPDLTKQLSGAQTWGFVLSARGVGLLLMGVLMYRLVARRLLRFGLLAGVVGALPLIALGLQLNAPGLIAAAFVGGLGSSALGVSWETSLQEHVPTQTLSRVASIDNLLSYIAIPVGQLLVGPLSAVFGGFRLALFAGLFYVVAALAPLASSAVRQLPHSVTDRQKVKKGTPATTAVPEPSSATAVAPGGEPGGRP